MRLRSRSSKCVLINGPARLTSASSGNAFAGLIEEQNSQSQPLLDGDNQSQQLQEYAPLETVDQSDSYLESRAQAVESIESTIVQLGQMYTQLVELVGQQEEVVLRIDSNIEDSLVNVEAGHNQLIKYFDSVSGSRWLIFKVFGVLIAFIILFMLFVA